MSFSGQLRENYHSFTKSGKKIADFIIKEPELFLGLSAIEIGEKSQSSAASVVRFAKALGFSSLEEMKITVAKNMKQLNNVENLNLISSKDDSDEVMLQKLLDHIVLSMKITTRDVSVSDIDKAAELIISAQSVYLYGIGASGLAAYDLYHKLNRAGIKSFYDFDSHMALEISYHTSKNDVVIAFSYSGRTKEVNYAVQKAKENGAKIIVVTRSKSSDLSKYADIIFLVPDIENLVRIGAISSKYTSMLVGDMLFLSIVNRKYDEIEAGFIETSKLTKKLKVKLSNDRS